MKQRRVALLIDNIESDYQTEMISGVLRATRAANVNALILPARSRHRVSPRCGISSTT
jgi:hypothetical protein